MTKTISKRKKWLIGNCFYLSILSSILSGIFAFLSPIINLIVNISNRTKNQKIIQIFQDTFYNWISTVKENLNNFTTILMILGFSILCSFIVLLMYYLWFKSKRSYKKFFGDDKKFEDDAFEGGAEFLYDEILNKGNKKEYEKMYLMDSDNSESGWVFNFKNFKKQSKKTNKKQTKPNEYYVIQEAHAKVLGGTGSGKTQRFIFPTAKYNINLPNINKRPNLVFTDPKGELYLGLKKDLESNDYQTIVFDFENPLSSFGFNFLNEIWEKYHSEFQNGLDKKAEAINDLSALIDSLTDWSTKDSFWSTAGKNILLVIGKFMLYYSEVNHNFTKKFFNFKNFNEMLSITSWTKGDWIKVLKNAENNAKIAKTSELKEKWMKLDIFWKEEALKIATTSENTLSGQLSHASRAVEQYSSDETIKSWSTRHEIEIDKWFLKSNISGEKPVAVFIKFPDYRENFNRLVTILINQIYAMLIRLANSSHNQKLFRKTLFLLDEFGNLPAIPNFDNKITISRSRNIFFAIVLQDYNQLKKYDQNGNPDVSKIIKNNLQLTLFFNSEDFDTLTEISKTLGNTKVKKISHSKNDSGDSSSESVSERPLISLEDLSILPKDQHIVMVANSKPMMLKSTFAYSVWNINKTNEILPAPRKFNAFEYSFNWQKELPYLDSQFLIDDDEYQIICKQMIKMSDEPDE